MGQCWCGLKYPSEVSRAFPVLEKLQGWGQRNGKTLVLAASGLGMVVFTTHNDSMSL